MRLARAGRRCAGRCPRRRAATQLVDLALARRRRLDLVGRVLGQLQPTLELGRIDVSSRSAASLARSARTASRPSSRSAVVPPNASSTSRCHAPCEQPLLLVLAVDLDQRPDTCRQARSGDRLVVDARDAAPLADDLADADERLGRRAIEQRLDARACGAVAHEAGSARAPMTRPSASMSSDLPAPVSPVITVRPGLERDARRAR